MPKIKTILLADDDENDVILIERAFAEAGVSQPVQVVRDGCEAMQYLSGEGEYANRSKFPFPSVMLLDLKMGRTGGAEVLRWLKSERPDLRRRLAIIILTGVERDEDLRLVYELGANSLLRKPLAYQTLLALARAVKDYWLEFNQLPEG